MILKNKNETSIKELLSAQTGVSRVGSILFGPMIMCMYKHIFHKSMVHDGTLRLTCSMHNKRLLKLDPGYFYKGGQS